MNVLLANGNMYMPPKSRRKIPTEADGKLFEDFEMASIFGMDNLCATVTLGKCNINMLIMRMVNKGRNTKELAGNEIRLPTPYLIDNYG